MRFRRTTASLIIGLTIVAVGAIAVFLRVGVNGRPTGGGPLVHWDFRQIETIRRFDAAEATQAVAVDNAHFYAIANSVIGKYDKETGIPVKTWQASDELPLFHLNSGVVRDGRLYCAHSNYPNFPESSSVEVFDVESMQFGARLPGHNGAAGELARFDLTIWTLI